MGLTPLTREELINKPVDSFLPILPSHPKGNETVDMRLPENRMPEVIDTLITTPHVLNELSAAIFSVINGDKNAQSAMDELAVKMDALLAE